MSQWLIIGVGLIYAYISLESLVRGNAAMAIIFGGYSLSNVGLWMAAR